MTNKENTVEQVVKPKKTLKGGTPINVSRQFGQPNGNPRHNGSWRKEDTARYKLEKMIVLTEDELVAIVKDKSAPMFERRIARSLLRENDFTTTERMINQVYGTPKQVIEQTNIEQPKPLFDRGENNAKNNHTKKDSKAKK